MKDNEFFIQRTQNDSLRHPLHQSPSNRAPGSNLKRWYRVAAIRVAAIRVVFALTMVWCVLATIPHSGWTDDPVSPPMRKKLDLFGADAARDNDTRIQADSPNIRKTRALVTEYINVSVRLAQQKDLYSSVSANLLAKQNEFRGLEREFLQKKGELAGALIEMERLRPNLALGKNHPLSQKYYLAKEQARGLQLDLSRFPERKVQLPRTITGLQREQAKVSGAMQQIHQQSLSFVESWSTILDPLAPLAPAEAEEIATLCDVKQFEHPDLLPVLAMEGCAKLHLNQPQEAISDFEECLKKMPPASEANRRVRHRCQMGLLWACIQAKELEKAGAAIAKLKKKMGRDYELILCEACWLREKGQEKQAFSKFARATEINQADPTAYRMAAEIINASPAPGKSISRAIDLAKMACDRDERRDYRNQLTLAHAYHLAGEITRRDEAIQAAEEFAGPIGQQMVREKVKAFQSTASESTSEPAENR